MCSALKGGSTKLEQSASFKDANTSKNYEDFIKTYEILFHLKPCESIDEIFNKIDSILIIKYKINFLMLYRSIYTAIQFNYRSVELYFKIIERFDKEYSETKNMISKVFKSNHFNIQYNCNENAVRISLNKFLFPKNDLIKNIIMNDQIDNFKEYIMENEISNTIIRIPDFAELSPIKACCYFGSVNIFYFLISNLQTSITHDCLVYSIIGGNVDIINKCMESNKIDKKCLNSYIRKKEI